MSQQPVPAPQADAVADADVSTDFLIAQVGRLHHKRAHALLEELGLYHGQPRLLLALWREEGQTQSGLAERLHVRPATITKMLQRMAEAGFVERRRDSQDQRVVRVYLTDHGRAVQEQVRQVWEQMEQEALAGFTEQERILLRRFLIQIRDNFRQQMPDHEGRGHKEKNIEVNR